MVYGERIRQVRELRGWTQTDLAELLGVTQPFIAKVEGDRASAPDQLIEKLCLVSGFLPLFFSREPEPDFPAGSLLFRSLASMTAKEAAEMYRYAQVTFGVLRTMLQKRRFKDFPVRVPTGVSPNPWEAAPLTRSELGLGQDTPIPHLTHILEKAGVMILALPKRFEHRDAFSLWVGYEHQRPVIVLAGGTSGDRLRMNIAHELGHLVMHKPVVNTVPEIEKEAYKFAGEFLMPEMAMRLEIVPPVTLDTFAALKPRWGVSIQSLIFRARELDIITPRKYTYLFKKLAMRGWKTREPRMLDVPVEKPRLLRQIAELLYGIPIRYPKFMEEVGIQESFLRSIIEAHAARLVESQTIQEPREDNRNGTLISFKSRPS